MTVRSTRLAAITTVQGGTNVVYQSPTGWRTIVKDVHFSNATGSTTNMHLVVRNNTSGADLTLIAQDVAVNTYIGLTTWLVLDPGDFIWYSDTTAGSVLWISGTLLLLTGAEPPTAATLPAPGPRTIRPEFQPNLAGS